MPLSSSSMSCPPSAKESLLLSHMESTDEWAGWCTVESEPVSPSPLPLFLASNNEIGNIQSIVMGYRSHTITDP